MERIEIIKNSFSIGDASNRIFGYCNRSSKNKIIKILEENSLDINLFKGKNKNRKYEIIIKKCPVCNREFQNFSGGGKEKTTCSIKCSNSYKPKRIKGSEKPRKSSKIKLKKFNCVICRFDFEKFTSRNLIKTCSNECRNKLHRKIQNKLIEDGFHKGWKSRNIESYPERFFKKVLTGMKINYIFNMPVSKKDLGIESSSFYFLDFFINKNGVKIDLEIDGKQHKISERLSSDVERDRLLSSNSYLVYRIEWNPINNEKGKEMMKNKISEFVEWYNSI